MDQHTAAFDRWRRHGDLQALGVVFDALAPRLLPVALHLCGHAADAEDALQQTFLLAMDRAASFDGAQRLEPWLAGLLQNVVRNQSRKNMRRRAEPLPECATDEIGPLDRAERDELIACLRTHIDALPSDQRQVLRLQLQHGMTAVAIAEVLELPPGTVRMRLHRGLASLRRVLPASLALLLAASLAPRGLAAVKSQVLAAGVAKAAAVGTGVGSVVMIGGALVTKKLVALLMVAGLLGSLWWFGGLLPLVPLTEAYGDPPSAPVAAEAAERAQGTEELVADARVPAPPKIADTPTEPGPTSLWGRVLDAATQQPVVAAKVELRYRDADSFWNLDLVYGERTSTLAHALSDRDGRFRFDVARASPHRLVVEAAGFAPKTALQCTGGSEVTIELTRGATLTGVVRSSGKPVIDATVCIEVRGESVELAAGQTDASGAFRFAGLSPALVYVQTSSARFAEKWTRFEIAEGGQQHLDIELEAGKVLRGRVLDAATGAPIQGARIADSWTMKRSVRSDVDGRFELAGLIADNYLMCQVMADGYASAQRNVGLQLESEVEFRLHRGGAVRGRIVDASGTAMAAAYVALCANFMEVPGMQDADWVAARLDASGRFLASGLRCHGHYWILLRAPGYGTRTYPLAHVLAEGEQLDVGDVVLHQAALIEGTVADEHGEPIAGIEVSVHGQNQDYRAWLAAAAEIDEVSQFCSRDTKTDGNGRFRFAGLAGGSYTVRASSERREPGAEVAVTLADGELREGIPLVVETGLALAGVLIAVDGKPFGDMLYLAAHAEGENAQAGRSVAIGADGSFRFAQLKAGTYTIAMTKQPAGQVMAPLFHVEAGRTDLRIALEVPSSVSGKVVDHLGKPMRANVYAFHDGVRSSAAAQLCLSDGTFRLEVPSSFRGRIGASLPARVVGGAQVTVHDVVAGRSDLLLTIAEGAMPQDR
jgi:RNA polymerase sigma-70 factor (ECF subfamily)